LHIENNILGISLLHAGTMVLPKATFCMKIFVKKEDIIVDKNYFFDREIANIIFDKIKHMKREKTLFFKRNKWLL